MKDEVFDLFLVTGGTYLWEQVWVQVQVQVQVRVQLAVPHI